MVRQNIFRRQNRADEETPLLAAEERGVARGDDSPQGLGRYRTVRRQININDPVRDNIRNLVNRDRPASNANVTDVEDETAPLLGRGSVRDNDPNPPQPVLRNAVRNINAGRRVMGLSHAADKVQHYTAGINSAAGNLNEFTLNHMPRYRENDDSVMNGFRGIGRGISRMVGGSLAAATVPFTLVGTGISEGLKLASGVPRRERLRAGDGGGRFSDNTRNNLIGTAVTAISGGINIAGGVVDIARGTGGLARSVYRSAAPVIREAGSNFAEGFKNSLDKEARDKILKRLLGIPTNVNIEDGFLSRLGFGSSTQAYSSMNDIKNAIVSLGNSRSNKGGFIGSAYDVAGFIR